MGEGFGWKGAKTHDTLRFEFICVVHGGVLLHELCSTRWCSLARVILSLLSLSPSLPHATRTHTHTCTDRATERQRKRKADSEGREGETARAHMRERERESGREERKNTMRLHDRASVCKDTSLIKDTSMKLVSRARHLARVTSDTSRSCHSHRARGSNRKVRVRD